VSRGECLAKALDARRVGHDAACWVVHVFGTYADDSGLWIQVGPYEDGTGNSVLQLTTDATVEDAIRALESMPPPDHRYPRIVRV
jgi:hypothetical protein